MIARADGQVILVAGAIPGERVTATIERLGRGVAYARTIDVEVPSADRRAPFTDPECGGCAFAHIEYPRQLSLKSQIIADAFQRIGKLNVTAPNVCASSPTDGYRMRARLHVRDGRIGFFREGTHTVCDARSTGQLLPSTADVLDRLVDVLAGRAPGVREVEISENLDASERAVHLETTDHLSAAMREQCPAVDGVTGITTSGTGGEPVVVSGVPYVNDRLTIGGEDVPLRRHVLAFFQANRHLVHGLVAHVAGHVPAGARVIDLYAGVGLFAIPLARRGDRVTAVEGDRVSSRDLADNALASGGSIETMHHAVETFLDSAPPKPETLIVDPPRTGMSREALGGAIALAAPRVVYVSCDVATLARDSRRLVDAGYAITSLDAFDMFPNTAHVETVVVFAQ